MNIMKILDDCIRLSRDESATVAEKQAAIETLNRLKKKYNVTDDEIDSSAVKIFTIGYSGKDEFKILVQVVAKVTNGTNMYYKKTPSGRKSWSEIMVKCTEAQKVQIDYLFDFYRTLYKKELELFLTSFIHKHDLFPPNPDESFNSKEQDELSPEELGRMMSMMRGMSDKSPHLAIED